MSEDITDALMPSCNAPVSQPDPLPGVLKEYDSFVRYANRLSGNYETARDLVQDAFVKLVERRDSIKQDNLGAWMRFSIHNAFISECRHNKSVYKHEKKLIGYSKIAEDTVAIPDFENDEISTKVTSAINALPEEFRAVFTDFANGLQYNEVAAKYQIPIGTVMSRVYRARLVLKETLEDHKVA